MCMMTYYPAGVMPDTGALLNGAEFNDDGHGFAIVDGERIIVRRGMDAEKLVATFANFRRTYPAGPALFHSRYATHGTTGKANCHPFRVGHDSRTVLAHNGILPRNVQPAKGDKRSDTRIAAEDYLPRLPFGWLGARRSRDRFARWLTPYNKILILTVDPRYRQNAYLINEDAGIWDGDIWYSNSDYRPWVPTKEDLADDMPASWLYDLSHTPCGTCHMVGCIDEMTGYCAVCGTCADCGEPQISCFCYVPSKMITR